MKKKIALITGISGQDGSYLAQFLLNKNYKIIGTSRKINSNNFWRLKRLNILNKITIKKMDLKNISLLKDLFKKHKKIDEIYNLAAQSFVGTSFKGPLNVANSTGLGILRILETIRILSPNTKVYQASSSEMFGDVLKSFQDEKTPLNPQSPYATAKSFGHHIIKNYRKSYNLYCVSGILFNHESPLRGEEYVTRKIVKGFAKISLGENNIIELGNIYAKRDWGYSKEYVVAMWKMLQQKRPEDFVIATGKTYSIKDFINTISEILKIKTKWVGKGYNEKLINLKNDKILIKIRKKYFRINDVNFFKGNAYKAKKKLKWRAKTNLKKLVKIMLEEEMKYIFKN